MSRVRRLVGDSPLDEEENRLPYVKSSGVVLLVPGDAAGFKTSHPQPIARSPNSQSALSMGDENSLANEVDLAKLRLRDVCHGERVSPSELARPHGHPHTIHGR
ncbi:hypothetical protein P3T21_006405 [Paraburkholderia sp. GAS334]